MSDNVQLNGIDEAKPDLHVLTRLGVGNTKVEARLPLRYEVNSGESLLGARNNPCPDSSSPELALLRTTPSVWMGQHELNFA